MEDTVEASLPQIIHIDDSKKADFEHLRDSLSVENKVAFLIAMTYGYKHDMRAPIEKRLGWTRTSYLDDEDKCLVSAIALASGSPANTHSLAKSLSIAEEYARGGITLLKDLWESSGELSGSLSVEVIASQKEAVGADI